MNLLLRQLMLGKWVFIHHISGSNKTVEDSFILWRRDVYWDWNICDVLIFHLILLSSVQFIVVTFDLHSNGHCLATSAIMNEEKPSPLKIVRSDSKKPPQEMLYFI